MISVIWQPTIYEPIQKHSDHVCKIPLPSCAADQKAVSIEYVSGLYYQHASPVYKHLIKYVTNIILKFYVWGTINICTRWFKYDRD